jgi:hypothetical protein
VEVRGGWSGAPGCRGRLRSTGRDRFARDKPRRSGRGSSALALENRVYANLSASNARRTAGHSGGLRWAQTQQRKCGRDGLWRGRETLGSCRPRHKPRKTPLAGEIRGENQATFPLRTLVEAGTEETRSRSAMAPERSVGIPAIGGAEDVNGTAALRRLPPSTFSRRPAWAREASGLLALADEILARLRMPRLRGEPDLSCPRSPHAQSFALALRAHRTRTPSPARSSVA